MSKSQKGKPRFASHAARSTAPREAILEFLINSKTHLSAKEIYSSLHNSCPGLGLSTVYRTLDLLARMGIVNKLSFGGGKSRYKFRSAEKEPHYHHLICMHCGKIIDYSEFLDEELSLVKTTEHRFTAKYNFIIHDHNIEFLGVCEKCNKINLIQGGE